MILYIGCFLLGSSLMANMFLISWLFDKEDEIQEIHEDYISVINQIQGNMEEEFDRGLN